MSICSKFILTDLSQKHLQKMLVLCFLFIYSSQATKSEGFFDATQIKCFFKWNTKICYPIENHAIYFKAVQTTNTDVSYKTVYISKVFFKKVDGDTIKISFNSVSQLVLIINNEHLMILRQARI